ncbi:MAG: hypothetical protein CM1200mP41_16560 [Gammaproteobacteria bacterium]|nr:MAG: hypothetical protein CM1200mP41_16560 [Gammaproteobacteria bacterium]
MGVILYLIGYQCNENKGSQCIFGPATHWGPGLLVNLGPWEWFYRALEPVFHGQAVLIFPARWLNHLPNEGRARCD